jgi:hypothetical protein
MVMMVGKFFSDPKRVALIAIAAVVVAFVCFVVFAGLGWNAFSNRKPPEATTEPVSFGYCGAQLAELCVVSFGRDVFGDTVINLYVPLRRYPVFYLNVIRRSGESRYECTWNKDDKSSVYCVGDAMNLGEGFEIQMYAKEDDRLLAQGSFILVAFSVTTPVVAGDDTAVVTTPTDSTFTESATSTVGTKKNATSTVTSTDESATNTDSTSTPTSTQSLSYPSYP